MRAGSDDLAWLLARHRLAALAEQLDGLHRQFGDDLLPEAVALSQACGHALAVLEPFAPPGWLRAVYGSQEWRSAVVDSEQEGDGNARG